LISNTLLHRKFTFFAATFPGVPDPAIAIACTRAGGCGILDLEFTTDSGQAGKSLAQLNQYTTGPFAVRLRAERDPFFRELIASFPERLAAVILTPADGHGLEQALELLRPLDVALLLECTSLAEGRLGEKLGVHGLIAKGSEAGGQVGDETTFILLQHFLGNFSLPVFARGGIGPRSVAGCHAAGAAGVILDTQLALTRESPLAAGIRNRIAKLDGRETTLVGESLSLPWRLWAPPAAAALAELVRLEGQLAGPGAAPGLINDQWREAIGRHVRQHDLFLFGQDIGAAQALANRYVTVAGVLQAMERAIDCTVPAVARSILSEKSAMAVSHATRYPLVQGPMARVSDTPAFAGEIARGGALPFLAAAWLRREELDPLLRETAALMGERSWGVGLLGFLPADVYQEQRELICRHRPPFALIAGGRPAQVKELEKEGIATYVHVPTPDLLTQFIDAGLTRFVFEGREAGGHVGPFTSFILWEKMIAALLRAPEKGPRANLHILFAGGIRDGLSTAIIAAMAAPLAAMGVRIGLQLGSAYLFTGEAVASGAILPRFQQEIIGCRKTTLLETAPGHAVRCVDTPFTRTFRQERQRLLASGAPAGEMRAALEKLERGRLRLATKGLRVNPDHPAVPGAPRLVAASELEQGEQGEYMIGELAALQSTPLTIAALHAELIGQGAARLDRLAGGSFASRPEPAQQPSDIAIIGMSCFFPKANDVTEYWSNIVNGVSAFREIPEQRWDWRRYFDADRRAPDRIYTKGGTFLDDIPFDPLRYGMPPKVLSSVEPLHLISLETARLALEDAGYGQRPFSRERTAVFFGLSGSGERGQMYGFRTMLPMFFGDASSAIIDHFSAVLPEWTEDSFPGILMNVAAGRIANRFDLGGANALVDAACASSLAALYLGVKELETGSCDMALVGSADCMQNPFTYMCFAKTQALSPRGICNCLDQSADGIVVGEGAVMLVAKRLADAERDGDRIYAVIKGMGASSDGRDRSLTAPGVKGQMRALHRAYAKSGITPADVELAEAHATGTTEGDRVELEAISTVYREAGVAPRRCAIGSVKSMIGHTKSAAGLASLLKVVLALHHKVLPPTLGVTRPNKGLAPADSPFYPNIRTRPWIARTRDRGRRAVASAFGFGGTNYHAVLEEYRADPVGRAEPAPFQQWPGELFFWHGAGAEEILGQLHDLQQKLPPDPQFSLADLAHTCAATRAAGPQRQEKKTGLALVASSVADLRSKLDAATGMLAAGKSDIIDPRGIYCCREPLGHAGKIAFLFPGQGSQHVNMLADLAVQFPFIRELFERSDLLLADRLDAFLSSFIFPAEVFGEDEKKSQKTALAHTRHAQPAMGTANLAILHLLRTVNIVPDMTAGHSYGEYAALCAAGVITEEDLILLSEARARFILEGAGDEPGTMAAVEADHHTVQTGVAGLPQVWIANLNSPRQSVITGTAAGIREAVARFAGQGIKARPLAVSCAFHSPLMQPAGAALEKFLHSIPFQRPRLPVYSNTTATAHAEDGGEIKKMLVRHLVEGVQFVKQINAMYEQGARIFVEAGPGTVLTSLTQQILARRPHVAVAANAPGRSGFSQFQHLMAQLISHGVAVQPEPFNSGRRLRRLDLGNLSRASALDRLAPTTWLVNGAGVRPLKDMPAGSGPGSIIPFPLPARRPQERQEAAGEEPLPAPLAAQTMAASSGPAAGSGGREQALLGFQKMMRQFLDSQHRVMTEFLQAKAQGRTAPSSPLASGKPAAAARAQDKQEAARLLPRYLLRPRQISKPHRTLPLAGEKTILITDDGRGIAAAVSAFFAGRGCKTALLSRQAREKAAVRCFPLQDWTEQEIRRAVQEIEKDVGPVATIIHLLPLQQWPPYQEMDCRQWQSRLLSEQGALFFLLQCCGESIRGSAPEGAAIVTATAMGGAFGLEPAGIGADYFPGHGGLGGFSKTLGLEWPGVRIRTVDLCPDEPIETLAAAIVAECEADDGVVQAGYRNGRRLAPELVELPLSSQPGGEPLQIDSASVILITGGARGITAAIAADLARRYRPTLILAGRSPLPAEEGAATVHLEQPPAIKKALIAQYRQEGKPFELAGIDRECAQILHNREIAAQLERMRGYGATVHYRQLDVRNEQEVAACLQAVYRDHGRLDGVIHGAGIIEDRLFAEKKWDSFARVFSTKCDGAYFLSKYLRPDSLRFLCFFASVAGSFGNAGQCDYSAANETLNKLALYLDAKWPGVHLFSLNWGPWAGSGMASDEVRKQFQAREVQLIDPADGVLSFHEELNRGRKGETELLLGGGPWRFLARTPSVAPRTFLPFFPDECLPLRRDGSLLLTRVLDRQVDLYLRDHCLDGKPVLPAAMAVELMAEAALAGRPQWQVVAVKDVKVLKGIVLESDTLELCIAVSPPQRGNNAEEMALAVRISAGPQGLPFYSGTVLLARTAADGKIHPLPEARRLTPWPMTARQAYEKWLFHGPLFQCIDRLEGNPEKEMVAQLQASSPQACLAGRTDGQWLADPVVLDGGLQMALLWARQTFDITVLPSSFAGVLLYRPLHAARQLFCHLQVVETISKQSIVYNMFFTDQHGVLHAMIDRVQATGSRELNRLVGEGSAIGQPEDTP
jgi:acyl transferase domain-containing protein/NAD(P)H-dependent flavin oxidoreductase YrpB (nitropropane dioxygenase family)/NAD(P)-dependent dehydrogenase (short-subunit alcohol dehydrogenase family)